MLTKPFNKAVMARFLELTLTNGNKISVSREHLQYFHPHKDGQKDYTSLSIQGSTQPIYITEPYWQVCKLIGD